MFTKIATLAALACATVSADDTGFRRGVCIVKKADGQKLGRIVFNQDYDNGSEAAEPVKLGAKLRNLMGEATAIRVFSEDPMTMPEQEADMCLGSWYNNKDGMIRFMNQYRMDVSLEGESSLEGKYIGVISLDDGHLCGCCEIKVQTEADEHDDE